MSSLAWRIVTVITLLTIAAWLWIASSQFAHAAQTCLPADTVIPEITGSKLAQTLAVVGTMKSDQGPIPFMAFANGKTGTWTMLSRPTEETACIIASGEGFEVSFGDEPEESM